MTAWWLAAVQSVPSTLVARGTGARAIVGVGWFTIIVGSVMTLIVSGLVVYAAIRRRGNLVEHESPGSEGGMAWIHLGGIAFPAAVLAVTFVLGLRSLGAFPVVAEASMTADSAAHARDGGDVLIDVTGHQWWWQVRYRYEDLRDEFETANELHIPVGRPVRVNLISRDVNHSFWIPQLHPKMDLIPGMMNTVVLKAEAPGKYRGECAEFCGRQHANMAFVVVAEPEPQFQEWVARQRQPAASPSDSLASEGFGVFLQHTCTYCHTVRGASATGSTAPDLTHLAARATLAAGTVPNTRGNLEAWILDAPALKPGTQMPRMNSFDGPSIQALVAYLETLR
jgi:cytochrome c oxidase subunit 2